MHLHITDVGEYFDGDGDLVKFDVYGIPMAATLESPIGAPFAVADFYHHGPEKGEHLYRMEQHDIDPIRKSQIGFWLLGAAVQAYTRSGPGASRFASGDDSPRAAFIEGDAHEIFADIYEQMEAEMDDDSLPLERTIHAPLAGARVPINVYLVGTADLTIPVAECSLDDRPDYRAATEYSTDASDLDRSALSSMAVRTLTEVAEALTEQVETGHANTSRLVSDTPLQDAVFIT